MGKEHLLQGSSVKIYYAFGKTRLISEIAMLSLIIEINTIIPHYVFPFSPA
jgi:hypothetical protein